MKQLPLAMPKILITYKNYFLAFSALYLLVPIPLLYYSQQSAFYDTSDIAFYILFVIAWYAPFCTIVILLAYVQDIENKRGRIRRPIQFIRQKHFTHHTNPKLAPISGAEIGVYRGNHALQMLNYLNLKKLYLIDPWENYKDHGVEGFPDRNSDEIYQSVKDRFSDYDNVELIRKTSIDAASLIEDSSLDFVYIDANHEYDHVLADLRAWYPKLKSDGVLCGDDFGAPSSVGLIKGVTKFAYENQLLVFSETEQFWMVKT